MKNLDLSDPRLWLLAALLWAIFTAPTSRARPQANPDDFGGFGGGDFGGGGAGGTF